MLALYTLRFLIHTFSMCVDIGSLLCILQAMELHDYPGRKSLAVSVVGTVVSKSVSIPSADEVGTK